MRVAEIVELLDLACRHGYPVRVYVRTPTDPEACAYDGWVWGSETPTTVTICEGEQRHQFVWGEIMEASFYTPLAERMTGRWLLENL